MAMNRHFEVVEPLRVWRQVGHSLSNDWVGSSRVMGTVREALNLLRGDEILLRPVGPLFAAHAGEGWVISLREPAPFAARKLHQDRSRDLVLHLETAGKLREIASPGTELDPDAAVRAVTGNVFPPLHPGTIVVEPSPELERALSDVRDAFGSLPEGAVPLSVEHGDSRHDAPATVTLRADPWWAEVRAYPDGLFRTRFPADLPYAGPVTFRGEDGVSYADARTASERVAVLSGISAAFAPARLPGLP